MEFLNLWIKLVIFSLLFYLLFKKYYSHASRNFPWHPMFRTKKSFFHTLSFNQDITKTAKYLCIYSVQYGFKQLLSVFSQRYCKGRKSNNCRHREIYSDEFWKRKLFYFNNRKTLRIFFNHITAVVIYLWHSFPQYLTIISLAFFKDLNDLHKRFLHYSWKISRFLN